MIIELQFVIFRDIKQLLMALKPLHQLKSTFNHDDILRM